MARSDTNLEGVLAAFRAIESQEDAITVLGDEDAMRVLAAWMKTDQTWSKPSGRMPALTARNHGTVWRWICSGWTINTVAIARGAGVSFRTAYEKIAMLQFARLIYPDGHVSKGARIALQVHVAAKLGIKGKRKKPDAREGESN